MRSARAVRRRKEAVPRLALAALLLFAVLLALGSGTARSADAGGNYWTPTGALSAGRVFATATTLPSGLVLIAGGCPDTSCTTALASTELYNPATGVFSPTGVMSTPRYGHTATLLPDGQVLVIGGGFNNHQALHSAELYDPASGTWSSTGALITARLNHTATLLPNGEVLVAGGCCYYNQVIGSVELYNPATGTFTSTGSLATARELHTATVLPTGQVLVAGGCTAIPQQCPPNSIASAELYTPATRRWTATAPMSTPRQSHTATLLQDGRVLVTGGAGTDGAAQASAETYNATTGVWSAAGVMSSGRAAHTATLLADGTVLIAGGWSGTLTTGYSVGTPLASAERYDPSAGTWTTMGPLALARAGQTAALLHNGQALIAGGTAGGPALAEAELFAPINWTTAGLSATALAFGSELVPLHTAAQTVAVTNTGNFPLMISSVVLTGTAEEAYGETTTCTDQALAPGAMCTITARFTPPSAGPHSAEILITDNTGNTPQSIGLSGTGVGPSTWLDTGSMALGQALQTATLLPDGSVLLAGGCGSYYYLLGNIAPRTECFPALNSAELYEASTGAFTTTGTMTSARAGHTATLLLNGSVLIAGGAGNAFVFTSSSAEVYSPTIGTFTATGSMSSARFGHTATRLADGTVLVAGGCTDATLNFGNNCDESLSSAERYAPAGGGFTRTGTLPFAPVFHTATLLRDGSVLVAGGLICRPSCQPTAQAALYHPDSGTWTATGSMSTPRYFHSATLLADGSVLVAGGCSTWDANNACTTALASAERYLPAADAWVPAGAMTAPRAQHAAALLPNGEVLVSGGAVASSERTVLATADSYDPASGTWSSTGAMSTARFGHTLTLLPDGQALAAGGSSCYSCSGNALSNADLYRLVSAAVTPRNARIGQTVVVSGSGFAANDTVALRLDSTTVRPLAFVTASAHGDFSSGLTVPLVSQGVHTLVAIGQQSSLSATAAITVRP